MSSENDNKDTIDDMTSDLRNDNFQPLKTEPAAHSFVKPKIVTGYVPEAELTPEQVISMSKYIEQSVAEQVAKARFDPTMSGQILPKAATPITDFSKLTMDDIYDLNQPIEAKAFMSADVLKIDLKDTNYEPRWVNKNPQRLGDLIAKGFTYVTKEDLNGADAIQTSLDAQGHYCFNDVVAMKIDKATYYAALRHAYLRAIATTDNAGARKKAAAVANGYMQNSENSNDFVTAARNKKMVFYDPEVGV